MNVRTIGVVNKVRKIYVDSSCFFNEDFKKYISKMRMKLCVSELTLSEISKIINIKDNEEFATNFEVLKINDQILKNAKRAY